MVNKTHKEFLHKRHTSFVRSAGVYYWWDVLDTEDNFEKNIDKLEFYINNPITYKINKHLFRSDFNFDDIKGKDVDIALGCSHTFGAGHISENTWPSILAYKTDRTVINLGTPGHGAEMSYINLKKYINHFNVKNVFHYQNIHHRYYYFNGKHSCFFATHEDENLPYKEEYRKKWLISDELILHNYHRAIDACKGVCADNGTNYYIISKAPDASNYDHTVDKYRMNKNSNPEDIPARDLMHFTKLEQEQIANWFYKKL